MNTRKKILLTNSEKSRKESETEFFGLEVKQKKSQIGCNVIYKPTKI
jgi:hypothetical protein